MIGLSTGFAVLDNLTGGMPNGSLIVLAGHPHAGRAALAMNIVEHVAIDAGCPVAIFSLELSRRQFMHQLFCARLEIGSDTISSGLLSKQDFPNLLRTSGEIAKAEIHIDDIPALDLSELR